MENQVHPLKEIAERFAKGDIAFAKAYFADTITWHILGEQSVHGKVQVLETLKMSQLASYPIINIKNIVAEGNCVVIESTGEASTKTGEPYRQQYCEIFTFENGKLQEVSTYLGTV